MKSFQQFITEAELHDREGLGTGTGLTHRTRTGKIGSERKKSELTTQLKQHQGQKKRVKAVGGGKTVEVGGYKQRKDVGKQRKTSDRVQQPTQKRGSASLTPREQQRKARAERLAGKSGGKSKAELEKAATKLLSKKTSKKVDPNYKPRKASGLSSAERKALTKKGERTLRDITLKSTGKKKESELKHPITQKEITRRNKKK